MQARNGGITEQLIGSLISATDVEDGDIAFGDNEINYLKVKNFDDRKIESARDKDIIEIVLEAKDSYGNITQKTISITFTDTQVKERTKAFGKIRFISEKYYGKNKAGGLMENSRWLNDPEFNSLLRQALAMSPYHYTSQWQIHRCHILWYTRFPAILLWYICDNQCKQFCRI